MSKEIKELHDAILRITQSVVVHTPRYSKFGGYDGENDIYTMDIARVLYHEEKYRKQSEVVDEFAKRLKEAPIKCGLPLLGLSTKEEIEEYFNGIMLQVRDAIDFIAKEMKGGEK